MNTTTATKKFALAALAAPVLAALALGMAGAAHADSPSSAADQISALQADGNHVVVNKDANTPLDQCSVISVRQDHLHHLDAVAGKHDEFHTAYVDLSCH
jgi:hypothetical protein